MPLNSKPSLLCPGLKRAIAESLEHVTSDAFENAPEEELDLDPETAAHLDDLTEIMMQTFEIDELRARTLVISSLILVAEYDPITREQLRALFGHGRN